MIRLLLWLLAAGAAALIADFLARRVAARGECGLHRALILPNSCQGRCPPGQRCVAFVTRPHWLGGREATGCGCIEARAGGDPVSPPDFASLPKRPDPLPAPTPEREDA